MYQDQMRSQTHVPVISLEGGPCAGKSSVLAAIRAGNYPYPLVVIPEVATALATELELQGTSFVDLAVRDRPGYLDCQRRIVATYILQIEAARAELQDTGGLIVTDRSPAGVKAYVTDDEWPEVVRAAVTTPERVYDYTDVVLFLASLAVSDPDAYYQVRATNPARSESVEEARLLHDVSRAVWSNHPDVRDIGGSDIDRKRQRAGDYITHIMQAVAVHA